MDQSALEIFFDLRFTFARVAVKTCPGHVRSRLHDLWNTLKVRHTRRRKIHQEIADFDKCNQRLDFRFFFSIRCRFSTLMMMSNGSWL